VTEHPDRIALLRYVEGDASVDRTSIAKHVLACAACRETREELQQVLRLLRQSDVLGSLDVPDDDPALRALLLRHVDSATADWNAAEHVVVKLRAQPLAVWDRFLREHPEHRTFGLALRVLKDAEAELDRRPEHALELTEIAERIGGGLDDVECRSTLGDAWKHRANALRHLGRYDEALDAAELAELFYRSLKSGDFDAAQAQYTRAVTLFKMTRYGEAMQELRVATKTLWLYGESVPLAKAMMLDAAIRIEEGDVQGAESRWRKVLPLLEKFNDRVEQARVHANLAECSLRLGAYDDALRDAERAVERYRALGMEVERIRSEWTIGMIHLARGKSDLGLHELTDVAAAFAAHGMALDAAFVKLDLCEELLQRGEWEAAAEAARELTILFSVARVTIACAQAAAFLRQAVENHEATTETVRYVRSFVLANDAARSFLPPPAANSVS
jgi:tetratricopeptide (TPR) repeat protein